MRLVDAADGLGRVDAERALALALAADPPAARQEALLHVLAEAGLGEADPARHEGVHDLDRGDALAAQQRLELPPQVVGGQVAARASRASTSPPPPRRRAATSAPVSSRLRRSGVTDATSLVAAARGARIAEIDERRGELDGARVALATACQAGSWRDPPDENESKPIVPGK
ncbi:MAG: hypothetical protein HS111_15210 [Kofleriaceae bacterium]|nr:hypothetical protein [Kofleriaceae bacterium]